MASRDQVPPAPSILTATAVKVFVEWLYTGVLPDSKKAWLEKLDLVQGEEDCMQTYTALGLVLLKAYVLGDRFVAPTFRSAIMDSIISHVLMSDKNDELPGASIELVNYSYINVVSKSAVVQLLVDGFCKHWPFANGSIKTVHKELPSAFLHRTLARFGGVQWACEEPLRCRKGVIAAGDKIDRYRYSGGSAAVQAEAEYKVVSEEETMLKHKLRSRCYREHLTEQGKNDCAKTYSHMRYDEEADYGFFE
ncbi:hypothetical protein TUN199_05749 [Pyrenophora tritici-repentis]|nr:hypothetical protein Alg215_06401 [Pyrenophora tritici-repentis]KAI0583341.1 hypothetical protein Alg130_05722 [Pyrenophora tritici-repentis]KAI0610295.1 hypothetical protein TUN205_05455 [Pyrenophora tritici-repentis]KAI0622256.1 hypothetical protein TUN199_05749 [Pyrenophora tritici-repentis]KAI1670029.1 hypothetical protein L13192_05545 [Pyrenophora tritici-repentis]